ncbi:MAG: hypothetical protein LUE86_07965 [Clostridiales bacterium]|nr:hypothetical protein [Clostridiales bacterium]
MDIKTGILRKLQCATSGQEPFNRQFLRMRRNLGAVAKQLDRGKKKEKA